ncbi:phytoene desaturase [Runella defluvii]|uniref:Phytoene desaturase n=1 Tax=Runella defluvii TaxID=370973 RepID=A0A7W6ESB9_9BACT|nr:1-hydroxycarotenoid 3,4-desaturase CrtD [Runella defluvii]MBB3840362.1 phytoene desaturase [Runella defluvii]
MKTAAVIGAGIAGIATSIRLANKGYEVHVFEANTYPGGKLSSFELNGYRFDAGPSLFTMPQLVDELFRLSGKDPKAYFDYIRLEEVCRYFWDDGVRLTAHADQQKFAQALEQTLGVPAQDVLEHLDDSALKYDVTEKLFLHRSLHKLGTYFNRDALKGYANLHRLDAFTTMNRANERRFSNPRVVQLFNRYATYNGSNPYETPATMNIIPHLEYNIGAFFPKKGMVDITDSLVKLAQDLGVTFHFGTKVTNILTEDNQVKGLQLTNNGKVEERTFDVVVSNMDVVNTFRKLLPNARQPERILRQPKSSSALIFYWGVKKQFNELELHNIFFSNDYRTEFEHLFQKKTIYSDPTVYINITSKYKPDDAPAGGENWFVMVNAPNNEGQDWDALIAQTREAIVQKLSHNLGVNLAELIECEAILDPRTIESKTSSSQGALYGNSSNNRFAAFLRHANFSRQFKNLYFVGGSVHPGGGIPLAILSAKIATAEL